MIVKDEFISRAFSMGVTDVRFVSAEGSLAFSETSRVNIGTQLKGASCIIILFTRYLPADAAPEGFMPLSAYYVASNTGYHAAKALSQWLCTQGAAALHDKDLPARAAALRGGGFIGDNGFYYHDQLGSLVAIHTILTDAFPPDDYAPGLNRCTHCGVCANACPSNATADLTRCLRKHINHDIPDALRGDVYQILGCERCQSVCPLNPSGKSKAHIYALEALISGEATDAVRALAGSNFVRSGRLKSQAALYAAATGQKKMLPQLLALSQNAEEPVRTHARWAYEKLAGGTTP